MFYYYISCFDYDTVCGFDMYVKVCLICINKDIWNNV